MCHAQKVASQTATSMARASTRASDSDQLKAHPDMSLQLGSYSYKLLSGKGSAVLSVSAGEERTSKYLEWAIGDGRFGQTFIYREQSRYYESQLSYYSRLNGLGTTTGHMEPKTLETAAGGLTTPIMIHQCFGCHSTASTTKSRFDPDGATMGISCEACHGPGASHVLLENQVGETWGSRGSIMNPATPRSLGFSRFLRSLSSDLCGCGYQWIVEDGRGQRSYAALPSAEEQVLGQRRRPDHLHLLPRSARSSRE